THDQRDRPAARGPLGFALASGPKTGRSALRRRRKRSPDPSRRLQLPPCRRLIGLIENCRSEPGTKVREARSARRRKGRGPRDRIPGPSGSGRLTKLTNSTVACGKVCPRRTCVRGFFVFYGSAHRAIKFFLFFPTVSRV